MISMGVNIPLPPKPTGTIQEQINQIYVWQYQLAQTLNAENKKEEKENVRKNR